jgi:hypothetical protein
MVLGEGFEPPPIDLEGRRSVQLSYPSKLLQVMKDVDSQEKESKDKEDE